ASPCRFYNERGGCLCFMTTGMGNGDGATRFQNPESCKSCPMCIREAANNMMIGSFVYICL
ncbi:MAG: hypothetical protein LIP12_06030, partial [Clostridiales bacterium]|nr:hypothetical protein [Clostridiales bacterium]